MTQIDLQSEQQPRAIPALSSPLVFVGGCPRSGTTLLQRMLDHHPALAVVNDAHFVPRALQKTSKSSYEAACRGEPIALSDELIGAVFNYHRFRRTGIDRRTYDEIAADSQTYADLVARLFDEVASRSGKRFAGEKTPDYVRHLALLWGLFPESKVVHLVRDGRNTTLSLLNWATPTKGPGRFVMWAEDPVATSALWWRSFVTGEAVDISDDRLRLVRYEDLLERTETALSEICEFVGLRFHESMLHFHQGKAAAKNGSAKSRWLPVTKGLRDWRDSMPQDDVATFELIAGEQLEHFGYPLSGYCPSRLAHDRAKRAIAAWNDGETTRRGRRTKPSQEADAAVVARETKLPALATAMDAAAFRELAGRSVEPVGRPVPSYVRYKPKRNCLISFTEFGQPWGYCVVHRNDARAKLKKAKRRLSGGEGFVDARLALAVHRFPFDHKLSALRPLVSDPNCGKAVDILQSVSATIGRITDVSVLSYKATRRAVLKLSDDEGQRFVFRVYADKRYRAAAAARKYMSDTQWDPAQRLGHSDRHRVVLTDWVEGCAPSLDDIETTMVSAGRLLARLHERLHPKLGVLDEHRYLSRMRASADSWCAVAGDRTAEIQALADRVERALLGSGCAFGLSHGDFHWGQLLVRDSALVALDWDNACNAPVSADLAAFAADLTLRGLVDGRDGSRDAIAEFIDTYADAAWAKPKAIEAYIAAALVRVGPAPFRLRHPRWRCISAQLLDEANWWLRADQHQQLKTATTKRSVKPTVTTDGTSDVEPWAAQTVKPAKYSSMCKLLSNARSAFRANWIVSPCCIKSKTEEASSIIVGDL